VSPPHLNRLRVMQARALLRCCACMLRELYTTAAPLYAARMYPPVAGVNVAMPIFCWVGDYRWCHRHRSVCVIPGESPPSRSLAGNASKGSTTCVLRGLSTPAAPLLSSHRSFERRALVCALPILCGVFDYRWCHRHRSFLEIVGEPPASRSLAGNARALLRVLACVLRGLSTPAAPLLKSLCSFTRMLSCEQSAAR